MRSLKLVIFMLRLFGGGKYAFNKNGDQFITFMNEFQNLIFILINL
jgi:hypothetical protein